MLVLFFINFLKKKLTRQFFTKIFVKSKNMNIFFTKILLPLFLEKFPLILKWLLKLVLTIKTY